MKNFLKRIQPFLVIAVSVLVLLICAAGIAGFWVVESATSSTAVQMLQAVDNVAQGMRVGVGGVDNGLVSLEESVSSVEAASDQLSQNVSDKGLLLTLLPTTKEQELTATVQSVRDDFAAIRDFLSATNEMVQAVNNLPFVSIPDNALASIETIQESMIRMTALVENLKASINESRSQAAVNISKITQSAANLNNLLIGMRSDLSQVDAELNTIQVQSRRLQELLPIILISSAIALTLMAIWIAYSQIVMINRAVAHLRGLGSSQAAIEPGEVEILTTQEAQSMANEETEASDTTITEAEENLQGNAEQGMNDQS
ncbi:MAG: hypothetical protein P8Z00_12500 [Anaerolineales bacterium]|jgi:hypothetical protein